MTLANLFGLVGFLLLNFVYLYAVLTEASSMHSCFIHRGRGKVCKKEHLFWMRNYPELPISRKFI